MQDEIEAKFVDQNHDEIRERLIKIGGICHQPMRLMKRAILDFPDSRLTAIHAYVRVRDEGDKTTVTYKQDSDNAFGSAREIETTVGSLDSMVSLLEVLGMQIQSRQESKRETWHTHDVEVVLDIWPWLEPFIEIEGPTKGAVQRVAKQLGLDWNQAVFGSVTEIYKIQYPDIERNGLVSTIPSISFGAPVPGWFNAKEK